MSGGSALPPARSLFLSAALSISPPGSDSSPPRYAPDFPLAAAGPRPAASHLTPGQFPRVTALARPRNGRARAPRRRACAAPCRAAPPRPLAAGSARVRRGCGAPMSGSHFGFLRRQGAAGPPVRGPFYLTARGRATGRAERCTGARPASLQLEARGDAAVLLPGTGAVLALRPAWRSRTCDEVNCASSALLLQPRLCLQPSVRRSRVTSPRAAAACCRRPFWVQLGGVPSQLCDGHVEMRAASGLKLCSECRVAAVRRCCCGMSSLRVCSELFAKTKNIGSDLFFLLPRP